MPKAGASSNAAPCMKYFFHKQNEEFCIFILFKLLHALSKQKNVELKMLENLDHHGIYFKRNCK